LPERLIWYVGDREPSISDVLTIDGIPVDLSAKTVTFKMRALGVTTPLKVNQPVSAKDANGNWRYDWGATDLDTAGEYLGWLVTTTAGKDDTVQEFSIEVRAHGPLTHAYIELEEFKGTTSLKGQTYADGDIQRAIVAASRGIEKALHRRFWLDADAAQVRTYTPRQAATLEIDDLVTLTTLKHDADGDGTFEETWTLNTDFVLEPLNAAAESYPYETIRLNPRGARFFSCYPRSIELTGKFGWLTVPDGVKQLTTIIASRLVQRTRQAPFGIVNIGPDGAAVRAAEIARDPEYAWLVEGLARIQVLA
jgi:hypothetical protein